MAINFNGVGIFEKDGQKVGLRPIEISTHYGENPILRAEVLHHLDRLDALRYATGGVIPRKREDLIKDVIFNNPATIVLWKDGTKTVVKCQEGDTYSKELGLAMCISKKYLGNKGNFNEVFKKWIPEEKIEPEPVEDIGTIKKHLYDYCKRRACLDCKLSGRKCTIACMTDEEVREAYKIIAEPEEDLDIEPIEPEPEDITDEDLTEALYSYCGSIPCNDCKIPKDEEGGCICIASMDREELLKTYKKIKEDK